MATIPLINKHRLEGDSRQWIFQKKMINDKKGNEQWRNIGYYGTLSGALNGSYAYFVRKSDADTIENFNAESKRIFKELAAALSPTIEINTGEF